MKLYTNIHRVAFHNAYLWFAAKNYCNIITATTSLGGLRCFFSMFHSSQYILVTTVTLHFLRSLVSPFLSFLFFLFGCFSTVAYYESLWASRNQFSANCVKLALHYIHATLNTSIPARAHTQHVCSPLGLPCPCQHLQ